MAVADERMPSEQPLVERLTEDGTLALEENAVPYRLLVEYANDAILVLQNGQAVYQNPAHATLLGCPLAELNRQGFLAFIAPEDRPRVADYYARRLRGEAVPEQYELDLLPCQGLRLTVEAKPRRIMYQGQPATLVVVRDITARTQAERARQAAHQQLLQLLTAIPSLLIGLDAHATIVWWNTAAEHLFGLAAAAVVGRPLAACGIPWDAAAVHTALATCQATGVAVRVDDLRFQHPAGTLGFLGVTLSPLSDRGDEALRFLLMGADITARKFLEAQLVRAQKLEAIGQLAAGIAHEINTPIQYVGDNTRFLQDAFGELGGLLKHYAALLQAAQAGRVPPSLLGTVEAAAAAVDVAYLTAEIPSALQQSLEGIERVATIVRAMKEFSHPGTADKTAIDLNKAIDSTLTVARNEWKYVAEVVTDFDPALPPVPCVPGELNQVVLNLIVNAAHAIADRLGTTGRQKGTITVRTRREPDWVVIRITDTGTGIPAAIREKIFDPFFTTKAVGKGTGQGLAIAHDVVVQKHGGTITVETAEGHGTTFMLRLPLAPRGTPSEG